MRPEIKNLPFSGQPLGTESYEKYQEYQPHVSVSAAKKGASNWSPRQTRDQKYRVCPFQGYHLEPKAIKSTKNINHMYRYLTLKKVLLTDLQDKHVTRNTESALFKDTTWNRKLKKSTKNINYMYL